MPVKEELQQLTKRILEENSSLGEIKQAADELYAFFLRLAEMPDDTVSKESIYLSSGKAIAPYWAGMCVAEFMRTRQFLRGIHQAITEISKKLINEPVHIFYAGCGPFGSLLVPLTTMFRSDEIKITFVDINLRSLECLQRVIFALGIEEYVAGIIEADLTDYVEERDIPIHIIVSETMNSALGKEPQVAITRCLVPLLKEGGILIPENIRVSAALVDSVKEQECMRGIESTDSYYYSLGTIFELNMTTARKPLDADGTFPEIILDFPEKMDHGYQDLCLFTEITVYRDIKLGNRQCSLTLANRILHIDWEYNQIRQIGLRYELGDKPSFQIRYIRQEKLPGKVTLEQIRDIHEETVFKIFSSIHSELSGLTEASGRDSQNLIRQQFVIEQKQLKQNYPKAERNLILLDQNPIGYLYTNQGDDIRIIELGLLEDYRSQGIGSFVVNDIISVANTLKKEISLQVFWFNTRAYEFYKRLGFRFVYNNGVTYELKYLPGNEQKRNSLLQGIILQ